MDPRWLAWAKRLAALAQNGLAYTDNPFDRERYEELRGIAAAMMAAYGHAEPERVAGLFARDRGYATPKVDVRGVVFRGDRLLLARERVDGGWTLPGGWADVGETPAEAVVKEIREETGYRVRAVKLLMMHDRDRHGHPPLPWGVYKLFIRCELEGGAAADSIETEGADFFSEDRIPPLSLSRVVPEQIRRCFEHLRNPGWATEFD